MTVGSKPRTPGNCQDDTEFTEDSAFSDPLIQGAAHTPEIQPDALDAILPRPRSGETLLQRYRIDRFLHSGGMGVVYAGFCKDLQAPVAVKFLRPENMPDELTEDYLSRIKLLFAKEGVASRISHPNVVRIHDTGHYRDRTPYIVMEYIDGVSLKNLLLSGPMHPTDVIRIMSQVLMALSAAHDQGLVHRDIKPSNILITSDPQGQDLVKVIDFGVARILEGDPSGFRTDTGSFLGTRHYSSPEQIRGQHVDASSDIYSCGVVMYQALTGTLPFSSRSGFKLIKLILESTPPPIRELAPDVPPFLEHAVEKAMSKEPRDRFQSARELQAAIEP